MRYIIDKATNKVVGTVDAGIPDSDDLEKTNRFLVESTKNIPVEIAQFKDGKIIEGEPQPPFPLPDTELFKQILEDQYNKLKEILGK